MTSAIPPSAPSVHVQGMHLRRATLDLVALPAEHSSPPELALTVNVSTAHRALSADRWAVAVTAQVECSVKSDQSALFRGEVTYETVATIKDCDASTVQFLLQAELPNQTLPFVRDTLSHLTLQSGYPVVLLPLFRFVPQLSAVTAEPSAAVIPLLH